MHELNYFLQKTIFFVNISFVLGMVNVIYECQQCFELDRSLQYDGSRLTRVSLDFIEATGRDGVIFRVLPFPDV